MAYIKHNLPPDNEDLEQLTWLVIQRTNASPICGWPDHVIQKAVQRLTSIRSDADVEAFFPLLVRDLKDVFGNEVIPLMLPYAKEHGLFLAGWPGLGKTPFAKIWALLLGQFWIDERGLDNRRPCWRRGKKIERFRAKAQEICELLLLDGANISQVDVEDWKAWFDLTESGSGDGRYTDAKYCTNAPRAMLTNEVDFTKEPPLGDAVTCEDFWQMVKGTFGQMSNGHLFAIFKRCITLIGSQKRLYLRLPSEDPAAPILTFTADGVAEDWFKGENKPFLSKYQEGTHAKYPGFDIHAAAQKDWAHGLINSPKKAPMALVAPRPGSTLWAAVPGTQATQDAGTGLAGASVAVPRGSRGGHDFPAVPSVGRGSTRRSRFCMPGAPGRMAASSSGSAAGSAQPDVKIEPINDAQIAQALAAHEELASQGAILIEDSPVRVNKRARRQSEPTQ